MATQTKRQELGERSREEILDAAARVMARAGYDGASISTICRECGLPASSVYWHFGSKDGVLAAVMERGAERFFADIGAAAPSARLRARERLRAQMKTSADAIARHQEFMRLFVLLLLSGHADGTVRRVRAEGRRRLHTMIQDAYSHEGNARAASLADAFADLALAMFDGAFLAVENDRSLTYAGMLGRVADALAALAESSPRVRRSGLSPRSPRKRSTGR